MLFIHIKHKTLFQISEISFIEYILKNYKDLDMMEFLLKILAAIDLLQPHQHTEQHSYRLKCAHLLRRRIEDDPPPRQSDIQEQHPS